MATFPDRYTIKNVGTGHYLTLPSATPQERVVCTPTPNGEKSQWRILKNADGGYRFQNVGSGNELFRPQISVKILGDKPGYSFHLRDAKPGYMIRARSNGGTVLQQEQGDKVTSAVQSGVDGKLEQKWLFEVAQKGGGDGDDGGVKPPPPPPTDEYPIKKGRYTIKNVKYGTVIDLEKQIPGDGVKIFGFGSNGGPNQKWDVEQSGTPPTMTLLCVATKKYSAYPEFKDGAELRSTGQAQQHYIIPADKGFYIGPKDMPGYVYDLAGGSADETPIKLKMNIGEDYQKWYFIETS